MDIAVEISKLLDSHPNGLKASQIATIIGTSRREVNSFLYSHKDLYQMLDGYIWIKKASKAPSPKNGFSQPRPNHQTSSISNDTFTAPLNLYYLMNGSRVEFTITPTKSSSYSITSTNGLIPCSECNSLCSIYAVYCPHCGCPLHIIVEKHYNAHSQKQLQQLSQIRQEEALAKKRREEAQREQEQQRIKEEQRKKEEAAKKQAELEEFKRAEIIRKHCAKYELWDIAVENLIKEKVTTEEIDRRIQRIRYYQNRYPELKIYMDISVYRNDVDKLVSQYLAQRKNKMSQKLPAKKMCSGNCSICEKPYCIEDL